MNTVQLYREQWSTGTARLCEEDYGMGTVEGINGTVAFVMKIRKDMCFGYLEYINEMDEDSMKKLHENKTGSEAGNEQAEKAKEAAEREENMKNRILSQVLDQNAMARLSNLSAAKPEKARMVENMIVQMARRGQIVGKMNDEKLRQLLSHFSERTRQTTTVKFDRRRAAIDSDSD
ncbi:unnamed protein product [Brugia pahangi]|uniref:Programmed cell death protein 5 n=3 Tax=Onchocercidae TaxID=6296 RepID=A0A0N4TV89_BRUPA|nr:unnamed protein product [Brugia pahangi]